MLRVEVRTRLGELELDAALETPPGRCLVIAGPSGAGKTTLLRITAGLTRPTHGRVSCGGEVWLDTAEGVDVAPEHRRCGYVFQDYALFDHLTARQNVEYALRERPRRERRGRALELLERFAIAHRANARPRTLSGGERQRVAVARALARRPRALLLDEPLSALDARTRAGAGRELAAVLRDAGVPTLLVTHDFAEAALLGDAVTVIDGGRLVQHGTAAELAAKPASAFVADFAGAVVLSGTAAPGADGLTHVALDGGGEVASTDRARGRVSVSVYPWEVSLAPDGSAATGSAQNRVRARVASITTIGTRVRIGLACPQPLTAEITDPALHALELRPGAPVIATWKAAATRVVELAAP